MKIQCSCGAKFAFDPTPDMASGAVKFICPACGLDNSDYVNQLVRQELAKPAASAGGAVPVAPPMRIRLPEAAKVAPEEAASGARPRCNKHPGQVAAEKCQVCSKPICPKCMALFGCVCSPLCRAKAEAQGLAVPVYAGQKSVREARRWRAMAWGGGILGVVLLGLLGFWFWYAWIGGNPRPVYSVSFAQPAYSGQTAVGGKDQLVCLHGTILSRHDLKQKREIWSQSLVHKPQIDAALAGAMKQAQAAVDRANNETPDSVPKMPDPERLRSSLEREAAAELDLRVHGQNVWVVSPGKLTRYDWETGNLGQEIPLRAEFGGVIPLGDELLALAAEPGSGTITRINLNTCETRTEELGPQAVAAAAGARDGVAAPAKSSRGAAGLPVGMPGRDAGKIMDPAKVAAQAQHLSLPASIALPAVLANARNQERTLAAASDPASRQAPPAAAQRPPEAAFRLIPTKDGVIQFSVRLLEERIVPRAVMSASPTGSPREGNLAGARNAGLANEILNDMQRERGGEVVPEDASRYLVTLRRAEVAEGWSGEVVGAPTLFPLSTVSVLAANKLVIVFDRENQKLWQSTLNFNVVGRLPAAAEAGAPYGYGPCVERQGALYLFDQGVLTAFDLATGGVRWRLPSVGIAGLFFDDQNLMYVNTTTASLESLKYSHQVDITRKDANVVMKLDPRTGKTLWRVSPGGLVSYVSGKFLYVVYSYASEAEEDSGMGGYTVDSIMGRHATLSIKRLNPANGRVMWEHCQDRAPCNVRFDQNSIRLIFQHEAQVLRFFSL